MSTIEDQELISKLQIELDIEKKKVDKLSKMLQKKNMYDKSNNENSFSKMKIYQNKINYIIDKLVFEISEEKKISKKLRIENNKLHQDFDYIVNDLIKYN